jgi:hypothetical protein
MAFDDDVRLSDARSIIIIIVGKKSVSGRGRHSDSLLKEDQWLAVVFSLCAPYMRWLLSSMDVSPFAGKWRRRCDGADSSVCVKIFLLALRSAKKAYTHRTAARLFSCSPFVATQIKETINKNMKVFSE